MSFNGRNNILRLRDRLRFTAARDLAPHVESAISRQNDRSEILVRIIQLCILALFGTLYLVSPRTDQATSFRLVPYALIFYLVVSVFGLVWSLRRRLPDWAVFGSIVFDIGVLMALIFSFHIQYGQPASFYLKAPTLLYVFIFIALRALRLEPRFVLAAGLLAALSWSAMVAYVVWSDGMAGVVTRDYVRYLTSNSLLVGAEIDKIISMLVVTAILWIALLRGRRLLVRSVAEASAAANLSRFFDAPLASRIRLSDAAGLGEAAVRQAAILFVDLRGFTALAARLEPDAVMAILSEYQRQIVMIVRQHGGSIDKFMGDGILATFGTMIESGTEAADALRALDAVIAVAAGWPGGAGPLGQLGPRPLGAAAVAGPVIFGAVGDGDRLEFTVIGPCVNTAAKLEKDNKSTESLGLTTVRTYELALEQGYERTVADEPAPYLPDRAEAEPCLILHR